ncbi:MAG: heme-binding domain-containing protein, partial [Bacteroidales bacterium]
YPSCKIAASTGNPPQEELSLGFPQDVAKLLEHSCYDCHINSSKNAKAKTKLNFSKWNDLSNARKIARLDDICKTLNEGEMPPSRYLSKNPDRALDKAQKELLCKWTEEEIDKIMGE